MYKKLNDKLEKLEENEYGNLSDNAKKIGIGPSHLISILGGISASKMQPSSPKRDFGPIGLDVNEIREGRGRRALEKVIIPFQIPHFRRGATPQSFDLVQVYDVQCQFALDGDGGKRIYCKFATNLSSGDYGVFLKKGTFIAGYFLNEESPLIYPDTKFNIPENTVTFKSKPVVSSVRNDPKSKLEQITPKDENAKPIEITPFSGITVFGRRIIPFGSEKRIVNCTIKLGERIGPIK